MNSLDVSTYYEYQGSLTSPPCTEGVTWYVIPNVRSLSKSQSNALAALWRMNTKFYGNSKVGNNRAVQSTNGRKVFSSNNKMFENPNAASTLMAGASAAVLAAAMLF